MGSQAGSLDGMPFVRLRALPKKRRIRRTLILVLALCVSCVSELRVAKVCCSLHNSGFLNFVGAFDVNRILKNLDMQFVPCRKEEQPRR